MTTQPKTKPARHTAGPLVAKRCPIACDLQIYALSHPREPIVANVNEYQIKNDTSVGCGCLDPEANARLLAASYTSYDRHFGPRAVEAAEDDLLGKCLDVLREIRDEPGSPSPEELRRLKLICALLTMAGKGE